MLGILIYLPTIAYIPHIIYLVVVLYLAIAKYKLNNDTNLQIILLIIFLTLINRLLFIDNHIFVGDKENILNLIIPGSIFLLATYYIAKYLTRKDINVLLFLTTFEAIIVIVEFKLGITTFFTGLDRYKDISGSSEMLLYFFRPMGLSENSSIVAGKIFLGLLLLHYNREYLSKYIKIIMFIILIIALVMTFNRTAIVAIGFFYILLLLRFYIIPSKKIKLLFYKFIITLLVISVFIYTYIYFFDDILLQFDRGGNTDVLTGRGAIWHSFYLFIQDHFIFGNGSYKIYLPFFHGDWTFAHAHNSYLEVLAMHGIVITLLYAYLILRNINKYNLVYILPIFVFSLTQYFIGWNISLQDIILFYFLIHITKKDVCEAVS